MEPNGKIAEARSWVRPDSFAAFLATCEDTEVCGRVCRSIGGQDVPLDKAEKILALVIKDDLRQMEERAEAKREQWRNRKIAWREKLQAQKSEIEAASRRSSRQRN